MARLWRRWLGSNLATAATEFALMAPVLLLFIGGVVEFGRIYQAYSLTNRLATQYAIAYADCYSSCGTELQYYTSSSAIANIAPQLVNTVTLQIAQFSMGTTPTLCPGNNNYTAGTTLSLPSTATFSSGQVGVIVTAKYSYSPIFLSTIMNTFLSQYKIVSYTVTQLTPNASCTS